PRFSSPVGQHLIGHCQTLTGLQCLDSLELLVFPASHTARAHNSSLAQPASAAGVCRRLTAAQRRRAGVNIVAVLFGSALPSGPACLLANRAEPIGCDR